MASTGRETTIQLPPPAPRSRGLLVDAAVSLSAEDTSYQGRDRLGQGVQHTPWGCAPLRTGNADCIADVLINGTGPAFDTQDPPEVIDGNVDGSAGDYDKLTALLDFDALSVHPAFKIVDGLQCSTISFPDANSSSFTSMTGRLQRRMRTLTSAALMGELVTGWASNGPSLISESVLLSDVATVGAAASAIEDHLASTLLGNRGTVFIPPMMLHTAIDVGWVVIEGGQLYTATGHLVVSDAGHVATQGVDSGGGGGLWVYSAGDIAYRVSDTILLGEGSETLVLASNIRQRLAEAYAQLAFDPCPMAAVAVDPGAIA